MSFRYRKVSERFKEMQGKIPVKIKEELINAQALVKEIEESIKEVKENKPIDNLQIQRLETARANAIRNLNNLNKSIPK